jgi:hypothetical protein
MQRKEIKEKKGKEIENRGLEKNGGRNEAKNEKK